MTVVYILHVLIKVEVMCLMKYFYITRKVPNCGSVVWNSRSLKNQQVRFHSFLNEWLQNIKRKEPLLSYFYISIVFFNRQTCSKMHLGLRQYLKMELFVRIFNGCKPLTITTKRSISDIAVAKGTPLVLQLQK